MNKANKMLIIFLVCMLASVAFGAINGIFQSEYESLELYEPKSCYKNIYLFALKHEGEIDMEEGKVLFILKADDEDKWDGYIYPAQSRHKVYHWRYHVVYMQDNKIYDFDKNEFSQGIEVKKYFSEMFPFEVKRFDAMRSNEGIDIRVISVRDYLSAWNLEEYWPNGRRRYRADRFVGNTSGNYPSIPVEELFKH